MFSKTHLIVASTLATCALMSAVSVHAADAPKEQATKMNSFLCKDIMRMSGDDRTVALAVMHGYYLGKKGTTEYMSSKLGKATDDFIEYCLDHPNDPALGSFGKFVK